MDLKILMLLIPFVFGADFSGYDCNQCFNNKGKMCLNDANFA